MNMTNDHITFSARYIEPMTLSERFSNHFLHWLSELFMVVIDMWGQDARSKALGHQVPTTAEIVE